MVPVCLVDKCSILLVTVTRLEDIAVSLTLHAISLPPPFLLTSPPLSLPPTCGHTVHKRASKLTLTVSLLGRLRAKPVRTASGIAVVAVMSKPHRCPHIATTGNICVYCPGGPDSDFEYSTQSYTGYEPTSMRAIRARYHPYVQARARVDQLRKLGHSVDKVLRTFPKHDVVVLTDICKFAQFTHCSAYG